MSSSIVSATVKSVLSADSAILRPDRIVRLDGIRAPARIGSRDRDEESWAYESRDALRALVVGKQVMFEPTHSVTPASGAQPLEFGILYVRSGEQQQPLDVALELVRSGWAKCRDESQPQRGEDGEDAEDSPVAATGGDDRKSRLRAAEDDARSHGRGIWAQAPPTDRVVKTSMPDDAVAFFNEHKRQPIDALVEGVQNGSTLRARLLLDDGKLHQFVTLAIAGIRAPRAPAVSDHSGGEPFGDDARQFLEQRLLQRNVKVMLLALPTPTATATSLGSSAPQQQPAATVGSYIGLVKHPAGAIAPLVVKSGLAHVVDWHAGFLSQSPAPKTMPELRQAEAEAKQARRGIWSHLPPPQSAQGSSGAASGASAGAKTFQATVSRVWGPDALSVIPKQGGNERRIQLASVRQPKLSDPKLAGYNLEGKEALRKKLIGKNVNVTIDYIKPAEGDFEARECATVRLPSNSQNVAEHLVERGLVHVIRHRQGDDQRSSAYDELMAAEAKAISEKRGVHSGKDSTAPRIAEASESASKAAPFLSTLKRAGRVQAVVDFVASGSRFKLLVPRQNCRLTLVLAHIRAPRTARNAHEKSEPFGEQAHSFTSSQLMQRNVEFTVDATDKAGGFIGRLFTPQGEDFAVALVRNGFAKVDDYSDRADLIEAQQEAQKQKLNVWANYVSDEEDHAEANGGGKIGLHEVAPGGGELVDCIVSDVRGGGETPFSFAVQLLRNGGIPELEQLMTQLSVNTPQVTDGTFVPRSGDLVTARFSADGQWYRAKVRRSNPVTKQAEVVYVDYGNSETVSHANLRPLAPQFKSLPSQAKEAALSFVKLLGSETEYGLDALDRFRSLCEGKQLRARIDGRERELIYISLFESDVTPAPATSVNAQLVRDGLAQIDRRSRLLAAHPAVADALQAASREAKLTRAGAYELGDILEDE